MALFNSLYTLRLFLNDANGLHHLILVRAVACPAVGAGGSNAIDNIHTVYDMAEGGVLSVKELAVGMHDKELAAGTVGIHGAGHADDPSLVADGVVDAVLGELALDGPAGAAHAGPLRIAALDHEAGDDPVEDGAVIKLCVDKLVTPCNKILRFTITRFSNTELTNAEVQLPTSVLLSVRYFEHWPFS